MMTKRPQHHSVNNDRKIRATTVTFVPKIILDDREVSSATHAAKGGNLV